jgi:hypothetical protein
MSKTIKYDDNLEKVLTAVFGLIGMVAIFINLHLKGYGTENWLDAIKDISGLVVVIAVFLIASKIFAFNKKRKFNFNEKFEEYLLEWALFNKYLIDTTEINILKGSNNVRAIDMICDHSLMLDCNDASTATSKKGSFLYLPKSDEFGSKESADSNKLSFKINKSMFKSNNEIFDFYEEKKGEITRKIATSIKIEFGNLNLNAVSNGDRIDVDFSKLEKTSENAKKLIDVVEFVKTLFLAIA